MIKRYLQQFRVDFDQIFVIVVTSITFYIFFAITNFYNLDIDQIDIKANFFMGK